jgi:hypothetical protein
MQIDPSCSVRFLSRMIFFGKAVPALPDHALGSGSMQIGSTLLCQVFEPHDLFAKAVPALPDHALGE